MALTQPGIKAAERQQQMIEALLGQQLSRGSQPVNTPIEGLANAGSSIVMALLAKRAGDNVDQAGAAQRQGMIDAWKKARGTAAPQPAAGGNDAMIDALLADPYTAEVGQEMLMEQFKQQFKDPPKPLVVEGKVLSPDGTRVIGDYSAPKPPASRNRVAGSQEITEEFDPATGRWKQVGAGPRWAPQQPREAPPPIFEDFRLPDGSVVKRVTYDRGRSWQDFGAPAAGGDETAAMRSRAAKIADAQRLYGLNEADASAIVDGIATVATDPVKGVHTIINKATGKGRPIDVPQQEIPLTGAAAPPPSMEEVAGATGLRGVASELASTTLGQVDPSFVDQQTTEARTQLRGLKQRLTYALSISGRPPVIEQERITALLPSEGVLESPERAKSVFNNLRDTLIRQRDADAQYINGGLASAKETPELRSRIYELDQIIRELSPGPVAKPASGGGAQQRIRLDAEGNIIP